ncbi:MAG TPA: M20 family metallopeptidase [Blastocatellia bacterium]
MMKNKLDGRELLSYFEARRAEILELIKWLVNQESMSREAEANRRIAENFGEQFSRFGADVEIIREPNSGAILIARCNSKSNEKQLLIVGHLDTVWPIGTLAERPFRIEGDRAYGPGIFDMKAGAAIAAYALGAIKELNGEAKRPVTVLLTCDEETGSHYSRDVIEEEGRRSRAALVLEPPIPGGIIKTGRKGVGEFEVIVRGRPAHAGNDPRGGISAVTEIAHQILAINALNDYDRGTTLNVGVVRGGVLSNVIAAEARAAVDLRFETVAEGERIIEAMQHLSPVLEGARIEVRGGINRPPLVRTEDIGLLFDHAKRMAAEVGFTLEEGAVGGGSDGNFIAALGVPVLDGLGVDGAGAHAEHEHIVISDIPRRAAMLTKLIETI